MIKSVEYGHMRVFRMLLTIVCVVALMPYTNSMAEAATVRKSIVIKATLTPASGSGLSLATLKAFTFVALNKHGRVILTQKLTNTTINKRTSNITLVRGQFPSGVSFHLISNTGAYYGPVVLGWNKGARTSSNLVSITLKGLSSNQTVINLGRITVRPKSAGQGYGFTQGNVSLATTAVVEAVAGVPEGIGTYGRTGGNTRSARATATEMYDGMDADDDGIVNAFDVNDDGDTVLDHQDTTTPTPPTPTGDTCEADASFTLFQNYKATDPNFVGTINQYGTDDVAITGSIDIQNALNNTVTFAIQRVNSVCGESVTKLEFKGVSVPYAPNDYIELPLTGGSDVQWHVGNRTFNNTTIDWSSKPAAEYAEDPFICTRGGCNINALDVFMQWVTTTSGKVYEFTTSPAFIFMAHPMTTEIAVIAATDDCSSATYTPVTYTDSNPDPAYTSSAYGSNSNRIQVLESDITAPTQKLCIKVHRPQRPEYAGENTDPDTTIYNIGKLNYTPDIPNGFDGSGPGGGLCDAVRISDSANDTVAVQGGSMETPVLLEWSMAALKSCFDARTATWTTGALAIDIQVTAPVNNSGNAAQKIFLDLLQVGS